MKFNLIPNSVKRFGATSILKLRKASPEILLGVGIACGIGAIVTACFASRKADKVVAEINEDLNEVEAKIEEAEKKEDYKEVRKLKKDMIGVWVNGGWKFAKLYGPTLLLTVAAGGSILTSHGILKKRYLSTVAAYKGLDEAYKAYRAYVRDELGYGEGEKAIAAQATCRDDIQEVDENGNVKKVDGNKLVMKGNKSPYVFDFNRYTAPTSWSPNPSINETFIRSQQRYINDLVQVRGHAFLNEALDALGLERTKEGAILGWFKGAGDPEVDFGYLDGYIRDFNTDSDLCRKNIRLNFNCDGAIFDMLPSNMK